MCSRLWKFSRCSVDWLSSRSVLCFVERCRPFWNPNKAFSTIYWTPLHICRLVLSSVQQGSSNSFNNKLNNCFVLTLLCLHLQALRKLSLVYLRAEDFLDEVFRCSQFLSPTKHRIVNILSSRIIGQCIALSLLSKLANGRPSLHWNLHLVRAGLCTKYLGSTKASNLAESRLFAT